MSASRRTAPLALAMFLSISAVGTLPGTAQEEFLAGPPAMPPAADPIPGQVPTPFPMVEPIDPPVPTIALRVRVPAISAPGAELHYRLIVENTSRAQAHHVVVRNPLPTNVQFLRATPEATEKDSELRWQLGTLEPAARKEIVFVVKPTGPGEVRCCARVQFEHGQCVTTRIGDAPAPPAPAPAPRPVVERPMPAPAPVVEGKPELRLHMTGPPQTIVEVGPVIDFRTDVTNVGTATAKAVVLTNKLPAGLDFSTSTPSVTGDQMGLVTWNLGDLLPGQTRQVVCTVIPKMTGAYTNRAEAREAAGGSWDASRSIMVGEPKLSVVTTGPRLRLVNRPATYLTTVSNPGTMPVTNVLVTSEVTEGMALLNATRGGFLSERRKRFDKVLDRDVTYQEVRWSLGTLAAGEKRRIEMVLQTANIGKLDHIVLATGDRNLEQRSLVQTEFEEATGMSLEIVKSPDPVEVGGEVRYTIRAINQGDGAAQNIAVTVVVPEEMKVLKEKVEPPGRVEGQSVTFSLPLLAAKSTGTFVLHVQAVKPGDVRLKTKLTCSQLMKGGPLSQEESTTIVADAPPGK